MKRCGGKKRQGGGTCGQAAGWGTDHAGQGRCKLHAGSTPVRSGRWSSIKRESVAERLALLKAADADPLDLIDDLQLMRAMTQDFIERFDAFAAALLEWHGSHKGRWAAVGKSVKALRKAGTVDRMRAAILGVEEALAATPDAKMPRQALDLADAVRLLEMCSRVAARIHKIRTTGAVSLDAFKATMDRMAIVVAQCVEDKGVLRQIEDGWMALPVEAKAPGEGRGPRRPGRKPYVH